MDSVAISFIAYTAVIMGFGIYSARFAKRTSSDFFLAGRGLGAWVAALSSSASAESGWVMLGLVGMAFNIGVGALWIIPGTLAAFLVNWCVIGNRLRRLSLQHEAITLPDVMAASYRGPAAVMIRLFGILIIVTMLTAYVAAQFTSAAKTFSATFGWEYSIGVGAGVAIVLLYTVVGGFRAVAWTDVLQSCVMVLVMVGLPILLISRLGGVGSMMDLLQAQSEGATLTHPVSGKVGMGLLGFFALWLGIPMGYPGQPHILVRFMATKDEKAIRRGAVISTAWVFFLFAGAVLIGVSARAHYGSLPDSEQALPTLVRDFAAQGVLPGVVSGFIIAGIMAAVCSTADSQLLVSGSAISHDLFFRFRKRKPDERTVNLINRATVIVLGLVAMAVALAEVRVIFDFVLYAWAGLAAAFGPALMLKLLWKRTSAPGVLAGMVTGFAVTIIWRHTPWLWERFFKYEMIPALGAAFLMVVIVSLLTPPREKGP